MRAVSKWRTVRAASSSRRRDSASALRLQVVLVVLNGCPVPYHRTMGLPLTIDYDTFAFFSARCVRARVPESSVTQIFTLVGGGCYEAQ